MSNNGSCPIWETGADGYAAHLQTMTFDTNYQMRFIWTLGLSFYILRVVDQSADVVI